MPDRSVARRVREHRDTLKVSGLSPVRIRVPDTRAPGFAEACRRQTALAAASDRADGELTRFVDAALEGPGAWE